VGRWVSCRQVQLGTTHIHLNSFLFLFSFFLTSIPLALTYIYHIMYMTKFEWSEETNYKQNHIIVKKQNIL
jgi:hypothetical protein